MSRLRTRSISVLAGEDSDWFIRPDGAKSIEVLALAPDISKVADKYPREIPGEWMRLFMLLCRCSGQVDTPHQGAERASVGEPLWRYEKDLLNATRGDVLWAAKEAQRRRRAR